MKKALQILVFLFVASSMHTFASPSGPTPSGHFYYDVDYSTPLTVGNPIIDTISLNEDGYTLNFGPSSPTPAHGYTVALKKGVTYTISAIVRTTNGEEAYLSPAVGLLTGGKFTKNTSDLLVCNFRSIFSSEVYAGKFFTPDTTGNYRILAANNFDNSNIKSAYVTVSVYETPVVYAEDANYTSISLGETTGTLFCTSDSLYRDGYARFSAKFFKVSLKANETYNIYYELSKKAEGQYTIVPSISVNGKSLSHSSQNEVCSVEPITYKPTSDGDCKIIIYNAYSGAAASEYKYRVIVEKADKLDNFDALDYSAEYTVGSVISGSLNADDRYVCYTSGQKAYYGYAEGYSVTVPNDGEYIYCLKEESADTYKKLSVIFGNSAENDIHDHNDGYDDPLFLLNKVDAGQYKMVLMSDQMNSADYKFAIRKVSTQPSDIDYSRKLTVGKSQSEYADPFSTQPFSPSESFFAYYSGYSVELEQGVTYRFNFTAQDTSFMSTGLFDEGNMDESLVYDDAQYVDQTVSSEFFYTPEKTGTYKLVAQFTENNSGFVAFGTPIQYMVDPVLSIDEVLSNATELTGAMHTAQFKYGKDAHLVEVFGHPYWGKAYKVSLAKGETLIEHYDDYHNYLLYNKDADGKFHMIIPGSDSKFIYSAPADTVLYFVLIVPPTGANVYEFMAGYVCKPVESLLDGAVEVAQLPYTKSGVFTPSGKNTQLYYWPDDEFGVNCGVYKLNIAKGEYVNYVFECENGRYLIFSKVDGECVIVDEFYDGTRLGGYGQDTTFYVANFVSDQVSPYKVTINNDTAVTLTELFDAATEIGSVPFYAEGNSAQNSTLTNIEEYWDEDRFTYANAYKVKLKAGEMVHIDYSSTENALMLLYSKNSSGSYDFIAFKNDGNSDSFYGDGEFYDYPAEADMDLYIYVAPYAEWTQIDWAFNVMIIPQKAPDIPTLFQLFDAATEIGSLPFYAEGNSADSSTLVNTKEYEKGAYFTYANAYKLSLKAGESVHIDYSSTENALMLLYSKNSSGSYDLIDYKNDGNSGSFYGEGEFYDYSAEADMDLYIYVAPNYEKTQTDWVFNVVKDMKDIKTPAMTLFQLFDAATEIGDIPFYEQGNSADNSTLVNIRRKEFKWNWFTYANAYKLSLSAGDKVYIEYSSKVDAYMLLYSKNDIGSYEFIDDINKNNSYNHNYDSFYGDGECYEYIAQTNMELYIYVAPDQQKIKTDWAFNVVVDKKDIKTPDVPTLFQLFDAATEIGSLPFYAEGNSVDSSTLVNIKEYKGSDYFTYANAYKLSLKAGEKVHIDYSSTENALMLLYSKNSSGSYELIYEKDSYFGNIGSFYSDGETYDYPASTDIELYIYVAPYKQKVQIDWTFNVVKDQNDIKEPVMTLFQLFDAATEIGMLPFYEQGNSADNSTLVNIREYRNESYKFLTYANAYKLKLKAGESVRIDYSSGDDALMLLYSKNAEGSYELIRDLYDGSNYNSYYNKGEYCYYTAPADMDLYIYVAPYFQEVQTCWTFNVVKDLNDIRTPVVTLTELFDAATEIGSFPFYEQGNSAANSTFTNIRQFRVDYWGDDGDYFTYANAYKLSLKAGEKGRIVYSSTEDARIILYSKDGFGKYECITSIDKYTSDNSFYGCGEFYDYSAESDTTIYIYVAPYFECVQTDWIFNVVKYDIKVPSVNNLTLADLLDNATKVDMNALQADGYAMYAGKATELYNTLDYVPYGSNMLTTAVAYKFEVPVGINIEFDGNGFDYYYFRKTANGYEYCGNTDLEYLMRNSAGDTLYVASLNSSCSVYYYQHIFSVYENVTEFKYPDFIFEHEPTKEDVMLALFENNPYFVNCFGDTVTVDINEFAVNNCNIDMKAHKVTYNVTYENGGTNPILDGYNFNVLKITARFGSLYTLAVSATDNGKVNSEVSGTYLSGQKVVVNAVPDEHYHFVKWSNGSVKTTDTITIVSDVTLIAEFAPHQYGEWDTTLVAICTVAGLRTHTCACGEVETDTIPALGHKVVTDSAVAATCTVAGLTEGSHCSVCHEIIKAQQAIAALGHKVVADSAVAATYTSTGLTEGSHCSVCDSIFVAQQVIPMLANKVTNVEVTTLPVKTAYKQGENLDVAGGVVTVSYSDESAQTFDIIAEMVSGFDSQKLGAQQLIVTVSGVSQTATFEVTVEKADAIDEKLSAEVVIYAHHNTIVVENAESDIYVYDATGRCIARREVACSVLIAMPREGIYIVRTGDKTQRVFVK